MVEQTVDLMVHLSVDKKAEMMVAMMAVKKVDNLVEHLVG